MIVSSNQTIINFAGVVLQINLWKADELCRTCTTLPAFEALREWHPTMQWPMSACLVAPPAAYSKDARGFQPRVGHTSDNNNTVIKCGLTTYNTLKNKHFPHRLHFLRPDRLMETKTSSATIVKYNTTLPTTYTSNSNISRPPPPHTLGENANTGYLVKPVSEVGFSLAHLVPFLRY